jgi:hypothetical protein
VVSRLISASSLDLLNTHLFHSLYQESSEGTSSGTDVKLKPAFSFSFGAASEGMLLPVVLSGAA